MCITGSHADDTHMASVVGDDHPHIHVGHTDNTHTHTHTAINRDDNNDGNNDNEKQGRATTTIIIVIIVVATREKQKKEKFRQNRGTLLLTRWLVPSLATIATTQTTALVGYRNQWVAEKEHGPSNQARSVRKNCRNTCIHKYEQSTEPRP